MNTTDIERLQDETLSNYDELKQMKNQETEFKRLSEMGSKDNPKDWLNQFFFRSAVMFNKILFRRANRPKDDAERLLSDVRIRVVLCKALNDRSRKSPLSESESIREIVKVLMEPYVIDTLSIKVNVEIMAFVSYELLQKGIKKYCEQHPS